jgi:hypothetical protein
MLPARTTGFLGGGRILLLAGTLCLLSTQGYGQSRSEPSPFRNLAGQWSGNGTVTLSSGTKERIRCRAEYMVATGGQGLRQHLRCASASYNFDLTSEVSHRGSTISGQWSEATRNTGGNVSGSIMGEGRIQAVVDGPGFSATLSLMTRGNQQSVRITSRGKELTEVSITLSRG